MRQKISKTQLLRLGIPKDPLILKLSQKASGTYEHSILVALLAEKAAKDIKANPLLVKVGAFYHDIGKILNPSFFIENQRDGNIHHYLTPEVSAKYIFSHVKEGLKLGKLYNLPAEICQFIRSHHGKGLISYFYNKAKNNNPKIKQSQYRYPGPEPETKEEIIVMLADSVEAAVASCDNVSKNLIYEVVEKVVTDKLNENKKSKKILKQNEITKIKKSFNSILAKLFLSNKKINHEKNS